MLVEIVIANLLLLACIWTGINACWGFFVSYLIRQSIKRRRELKLRPNFEHYETYCGYAVFALSFILLGCLVISGMFGASVIVESLLVYNVFHTILLSSLTVELLYWWYKHGE